MSRAIEVAPARAFHERRRLFGALSEALSIDLCEAGSALSPLGRVVIDESVEAPDLPTLTLGVADGQPGGASAVRFSQSEATPAPFRGWSIPDVRVAAARSLGSSTNATILAEVSGRPVWTTEQRGKVRLDRANLIPDELGVNSTLLSRWTPGGFFDLLPLIEFIRSVGGEPWTSPPLMASLLIDDPNLRFMRYGYLDFGWLAQQGFHTSISTIPLDSWYINPDVAELFRSNPETMSVLIHGNNHTRKELHSTASDERRLALLAQALRRVRAASAKAGLTVHEVMSAPHGSCSEQSSRDMAMLGFESLCINEAIPWLEEPSGTHPLAGWFPADTSSWTPVLHRIGISEPRELLPLRAYLGQPIIAYGHHWDLADQPDVLQSWASDIERLGDVEWASIGAISRRTFSTRAEGDSIIVKPHSRVIEFPPNGAIQNVRIEAPDRDGYEVVEVGNGQIWDRYPGREADLSIRKNEGLTIRMRPSTAITADQVPDPSWRPWPVVRRLLTESRDRTQRFRDSLLGAVSLRGRT